MNSGRFNLVIAIGGSGARVVEAMVHLAAAGFFTYRDNIHILFVDPDINNANVVQANDLIYLYYTIHKRLSSALERFADKTKKPRENADLHLPIFAANIEPIMGIDTNVNTLNPLVVSDGKSIVGKAYDYNISSLFNVGSYPSSRFLIQALYSQRERTLNLEVGFRGRPSIGSPVFLYSLNRNNIWNKVIQTLGYNRAQGENEKPRVILVGSVFGGTGASGLPTISKRLRDEFGQDIKLAGIFMLPYFEFDVIWTGDDILANPAAFNYKSTQALRYYLSAGYDRIFDHIYFVGSEENIKFKTFSLGGIEQSNPITVVDLIAATAIKDFLWRDFSHTNSNVSNSKAKVSYFRTNIVNDKIIFSNIEIRGDYGAFIRPITFINLFLIMTFMVTAFFSLSPISIGDRLFEGLKAGSSDAFEQDSFIKIHLMEYLKHFIRFVREASHHAEEKIVGGVLLPDILLDSLIYMLKDAYFILDRRLNPWNDELERENFLKVYYRFLHHYRGTLSKLNKVVINALAAEDFYNEEMFSVLLYTYTVYYSYELVKELTGQDTEWSEILVLETMRFIVQIVKSILSMYGINLLVPEGGNNA